MKEKIVDELLNYFIKEHTDYFMDIPKTYDEKRFLLRGLINIREPKKISQKVLNKESELLQLELKEKEVLDVQKFKEKIVIWKGDITTIRCEAIVNACNEYLLGCFIPNHTCIDNQIHTYAGISLRLKCHEIMQGKTLNNGKVIVTSGYNLPCKYIIHTVGPKIVGKVKPEDKRDLQNCYLNALKIAKEKHIRTIAFPCISTGVYGYPKKLAASVAIQTVKDYLKEDESSFDCIIFNVFTDEDYQIYQDEVKK